MPKKSTPPAASTRQTLFGEEEIAAPAPSKGGRHAAASQDLETSPAAAVLPPDLGPDATAEEWAALCAAAQRLRAATPWERAYEDQCFAVENPETGDFGVVSLMGRQGEHLALALYLGAEGFNGFRAMHELESELIDPAMVFETPQLQVSFEDREGLNPRDREILKKAGLKPRGAQAWPRFREYRAGWADWHPSGAQVRFLGVAINATLSLGARLRQLKGRSHAKGGWAGSLLLLRRTADGWAEDAVTVPRAAEINIPVPLDEVALARLRALPLKGEVEADLLLLPTPILNLARPYYPYMLLLCDAHSRLGMGMEMLSPPELGGMEALLAATAPVLLKQLTAQNLRPRKLFARSGRAARLFAPLAQALGSALVESDELPVVDEMREIVFMRMM